MSRAVWRVEPLDGADDPRFPHWYAQVAASMPYERPWLSVPSAAFLQARLRVQLFDRTTALVALDDDGEVVGAGEATVNLQGNTHFGWGDVQVAPDVRRRGIGTALVGAVEDVVRASGARFALLASHYPFAERETHGYRRFAEGLGYALDLDEIYRVLALPVDPDLLARLADEAAEHHRGYRVVTWVYDVPERYLASWIDVHNKLGSDAPSGVVQFEEDGMDATSWAEEVAQLRSVGRELRSTVAISPDDEVVAYNDLVLQDNGTGRVSQWGTLVRADHRGHRLGLAVKVAGLRSLAETHPDRTEVHTTNAEVNAQMIGINEALGFRPVAVHPGFYREIRG
ncbi:MAG: GNAT family N-acetyltransferase [Nocardioides sp.]|nr:GNAT family N-acetyltransferase [Nocardioides sp.]